MNLLRNDLLKFRRSHIWTVIVLIPLIAVAIGSANYIANSDELNDGWDSYFSQVLLFYGLVFMTIGVSIIAASTWRFEHKGHNWHTIMTSTRPAGKLIASKVAIVTVVVSVMQVALLLFTMLGALVLSVPGQFPWSRVIAILLAIIPGIAVASWQSFLSMIIRNFAAPIAIALLMCIFSIGILSSGASGAAYFIPPALLTSSISLGSTAVSTSATLDVTGVATIVCSAAALTGLGWLASVVYLKKVDIRL